MGRQIDCFTRIAGASKVRYLASCGWNSYPYTPRFIGYMRATCSRYMELKPLLRLIERVEGIPVPTAFSFGRM